MANVFDRILYVSGPRGEDGVQGPEGPQGPPGSSGAQATSVSITVGSDGTLGTGLLDDPNFLQASRVEVTSSAVRNLHGMYAVTTINGMVPIKTIVNVGNFDIILENQSGSAIAKDRFSLSVIDGTSYTLKPGHSVSFGGGYDYVAQRWKKSVDPEAIIPLPTLEDSIATSGRVNEIRQTSGFAADSGARPFEIYFSPLTTPAVDNVNVYAVFPGIGSWRPVRKTVSSALRSMNIRGNGSADDTAALENSIRKYLKNPGDELHFDPGTTIRITDTLVIDNLDGIPYNAGLRCGGASTHGTGGTTILYDGVYTDRPAVMLSAGMFRMRGINVSWATGRSLPYLFGYGFYPSQGGGNPYPYVVTAPTFDYCTLGGPDAGCDYIFVVEPDNVANFNLDFGRFFRCAFINGNQALIRFVQGQPLQWVFDNCLFTQAGIVGAGLAHGRGFLLEAQACSLSIINPSIGDLSRFIDCQTSVGISISGYSDEERCKQLLYSPNSAVQGRPFTWNGGRFAFNQYGVASTNPTIPADDNAFIDSNLGGMTIQLLGCDMRDDGGNSLPDAAISLGGNVDFIAKGCNFWNKDYLRRPDSPPVGFRPGGHYREGCKYQITDPSHTLDALPDLYGCNNPHDEITLSDTISTITLVNSPHELTDDYLVDVSIVARTSSPATSYAHITSKTKEQVTIALDAAPGSGKSVRLNVQRHLASTDTAAPSLGMLAGDDTTLFGTAVGAGLVGNAAGHWVGVTFYVNTLPPSSQRVLFQNGENVVSGHELHFTFDGRMLYYCHGAGVSNLLTSTVNALEEKKFFAALAYFDGSRSGLYLNRIHYAPSGSAITFVAGSAYRSVINKHPFAAGVHNDTFAPIFGVVGGNGVPTSGEVTAWFDAVEEGNLKPSISGKISHAWLTNGSTTVNDTVGASNMSLVSGTAAAVRAFRLSTSL